MPLSKDRELIQITSPAYKHLRRIKQQRKRLGLPYTMTGIVSEMILSQPLYQNGNTPAPVDAVEVNKSQSEQTPS